MRSKIVVGNWKMNGDISSLSTFAREIVGGHQVELAIAVPATLIGPAVSCMPGMRIGAQDVAAISHGPFTGSISAAMMREAGASFTIVGHSERRSGLGDDDATVRAKAFAALQAGLTVLLCVGDANGLSSGLNHHLVAEQLVRSLPDLPTPSALMVAYEPITAIGTGLSARKSEIEDALGTLRGALCKHVGKEAHEIRLLYGGSVSTKSVVEIVRASGLDGLLVGKASLSAPALLSIARAASSFDSLDG